MAAVAEDGVIMPGYLRDSELAFGARSESRSPISAEPLRIVATCRSFVMVGEVTDAKMGKEQLPRVTLKEYFLCI